MSVEPTQEIGAENAPSPLEHTLSLSYEERIEAHQAALELVQELAQAGQNYYAKQSEGTT